MNDGFVPGTTSSLRRSVVSGPLRGLRLSVKDVIDVAGIRTGAGQPDWADTHPPPTADAEVVELLLAAGAEFVGKSHTDEMAYSLFGSNHHYGTPANPRAPGHLPGGSSSGAASTVAGGVADVGLGTDTAGSIRVPASWSGLVGFRPTHTRVSRKGLVPLAPRFDVPGLIARDLETIRRAAAVLLSEPNAGIAVSELVFAANHWSDPVIRGALRSGCERLSSLLPTQTSTLPDAPVEAFAVSQGAQAWQVHGDWITRTAPEFGPGVASRFRAAAGLTADDVAAAERELNAFCDSLHFILSAGIVIVLPTTPGSAPPEDQPPSAHVRRRMISLTMLASAAGLPAVSLPVGRLDGRPLGLSLIGAAGQDEQLLSLAGELASLLR